MAVNKAEWTFEDEMHLNKVLKAKPTNKEDIEFVRGILFSFATRFNLELPPSVSTTSLQERLKKAQEEMKSKRGK
jgi:hypothetical protein